MANNRLVVYTCVTGGYDSLREIRYVSPNIDYICFTDNPSLSSKTWKIRLLPKEFDSEKTVVKKQRMIKLLPHKLFPEYSASLWIDSNIEVIGDLYDFFSKYDLSKKFLYVNKHPSRDCLYREQLAVIRLNKDTFENTSPQINRYRDEGFPEHYGLAETNILLRAHNDKRCIKLMEAWAKEIRNGSHRDQLSFNYCIWKCDCKASVEYLDEKYYNLHVSDNAFFCLRHHTAVGNINTPTIKPQPKVESAPEKKKEFINSFAKEIVAKPQIKTNEIKPIANKKPVQEKQIAPVSQRIDKKPINKIPSVSVVIFTHNRTNVASETIKSLFKNLKYSGDICWVISDDRSTPEHIKAIAELFAKNGIKYDLCQTTQTHFGLGASMNNGIKKGFEKSDIVLRVEDDWILQKELNLDKHVKALRENNMIAGIRLGMVAGGPIKSDSNICSLKDYKTLVGNDNSVWILCNQVALVHKRLHDKLGWYKENISADKSEEDFKTRFNQVTSSGTKNMFILAPAEMKWWTFDDPSLWFIHVGRSTLGHQIYREPVRYRWIYDRTPIDLSIVVPCYNIEKYIGDCLTSILNQQTAFDYEVICVDNGSTDGTRKILDDFAVRNSKVTVVTLEKKSLGLARNKGLNIAAGKFVSFVDGDDLIANTYVESTLKAMLGKNLDACYFALDTFSDGSSSFKTLTRVSECIKRSQIDFTKVFATNQLKDVDFIVSQCSQIYSREFLNDNGLRFTDAKFGEDTLFFLNAFPKISRCFYIDKPLYHYRINRPNSLISEAEKDTSKQKEWASLVCKEFNEKIFNKLSDAEANKYRQKIKKEISYYLKDFDFSVLNENTPFTWPKISVMMTTHNRTAVASFVLNNLIKKLKYSGDIHWIICDDRSAKGHLDVIESKFIENNVKDYSIFTTDSKRWGLGSSMNNGLKDAFKNGDIVLTTEDDWYLRNNYFIDDKVKLLLNDGNIAGIRIGALCNELGSNLKQDSKYKDYYKLEAPRNKDGRFFIFNNQVMIRHKRIFDKIGYMKENCPPDEQEQTMVTRYNNLTDFGRKEIFKTLWPKGYDVATLYGEHNPFFHIGRSTIQGKNRQIRKDFSYLNNDKLDEELRAAFVDDKKQGVFFKVIIPSYNVEKYIERCVESVEKQTFKNFHIIVADDMSTDRTRGILTDLSLKYKNLTVCFLNKKVCAGGARNAGIKMQPSSWYTIFLDSDDYFIDNTAFQQIYDCIKKNNNPDCIELSYEREMKGSAPINMIARSKNVDDLLKLRVFAPWRKVIRSAILKDFKADRLRANDVIWTFRQADATKTFTKIEKPLIHYSTSNPISGWNGEKKNKADLDKAIDLLLKDLEEERYGDKVDKWRKKEIELIIKREGIYKR